MTWNTAVYALVRRIPRGRVATYGQIALLLGRPRGGREVGWAMSACADPTVPCHRVVDRNGRLAPRFAGIGGRFTGSVQRNALRNRRAHAFAQLQVIPEPLTAQFVALSAFALTVVRLRLRRLRRRLAAAS